MGDPGPGYLRPQAEPSRLGPCRQGPRAQDGFRAPHSVGLALSGTRGFGAFIWLQGAETQRSRGLWSPPGCPGNQEPPPGAGPSHCTDGAEWQEVRGLAQGQVASKQAAGPGLEQPRLSRGSRSLGQVPRAGLLPAAPAPSQTPRGSQTRPRWRRFARRSTRPWRRTANTSTPSSQEGEPRPSLCLDGPRGLFADPLPRAGPHHQPFRHSCELEGDTLPSPRAVGD